MIMNRTPGNRADAASVQLGLTAEMSAPAPLQVYFDGGCPVCSREVAFYKVRPGIAGFTWVDVSDVDGATLGPGLTREAALARMHVRREDGTLLSGAAAFAEMWRRMPGFTWLGRLVALPPMRAVAELAYRGFLRARRLWR
jgi:predicted DCC family thiol-disulfide oxidoreductase YuxK